MSLLLTQQSNKTKQFVSSKKSDFANSIVLYEENDSNIADNLYKSYNLLLKLNKDENIRPEYNLLFNCVLGFIVIEIIEKRTKASLHVRHFYLDFISNEIPNFKKSKITNTEEFISDVCHTILKKCTSSDLEKIYTLFDKVKVELNRLSSIHTVNKILGRLFEKIITKKEIGAYYTNYDTTNYIVQNTIIPSIVKNWSEIEPSVFTSIISKHGSIEEFIVNSIINKSSSLEILEKLIKNNPENKFKRVLKDIKIVDISCGSGSFIFNSIDLIKKLDKLSAGSSSEFRFGEITQNNLFGIDIDQEAINILRLRICLESIINSELNFEVLKKCFANFMQGNSLLHTDSIKSKVDKSIFKNKLFKSVIKKGGFDVVVGNPPYVEYSKIITHYSIDNLHSKSCNNLYAYILEVNFEILKESGHLGMIIPISFVSTKRMTPIREYLSHNSDYLFCANFADRPSCLFNGVHQKLNIILQNKNTINPSKKLYTSNYIHWYTDERNKLFDNLQYIRNSVSKSDFMFKIGNRTELNIISKMINPSKKSLLDIQSKNGNYKVWLNMRMTFWCKSFTFEHNSKEYKCFNFDNKKFSILFSAFLNSNIFFFFWESISDVWHITQKELENIRIDFSVLTENNIDDILNTYQILEQNLSKNKKRINSKQTEFEYQHKKDKVLMDKLDNLFSKCFNLNNEEIEYLRNYQLKFRLNGELETYLKSYKK